MKQSLINMKQSLVKTSGWLAIGAFSLLPISSNATVIATEYFDYDDTTDLAAVGTGGTGWDGGWTTTGTSFDVVDGAAYTGNRDEFVNFRTLTNSQSTGTVYFAWTGEKSRTSDVGETQVLAVSGFSNGTSTEEFSLQFRTNSGDVDSEFFLLYANDGGSTSGGTYKEGTEITFVLQIEFNASDNETISAWAFTDGLPVSLGSALLTESASIASIDSIRIQSNGTNMTGSLDNLVIATEYSDILNAIPEPSAYSALLGIGALVMLMPRRRRA